MKQKAHPAGNKFFDEMYPHLSSEGKRKADILFDEYALGSRALTPEEIEEAQKILVQIVEAHTVKAPLSGSWAPSWRVVLTVVVLTTVVFAVIFNAGWFSVFFMSAWGAAAVLCVLVALLIASSKANYTE